MIKLFSFLIIIFTIISCAGNRKVTIIGDLKDKNNKYLGSLRGIQKSNGLYSNIFVIVKKDTIFNINEFGLYSRRRLVENIKTVDYDGWGIEMKSYGQIIVWLERKDNASDPITIQWVDTLNSFTEILEP